MHVWSLEGDETLCISPHWHLTSIGQTSSPHSRNQLPSFRQADRSVLWAKAQSRPQYILAELE